MLSCIFIFLCMFKIQQQRLKSETVKTKVLVKKWTPNSLKIFYTCVDMICLLRGKISKRLRIGIDIVKSFCWLLCTHYICHFLTYPLAREMHLVKQFSKLGFHCK